jgi:hypothetical protein
LGFFPLALACLLVGFSTAPIGSPLVKTSAEMAGRALPPRARARTLSHPARAAKRSIFFVTLADMGAANSRVRGHSQR